MNNIRNYHTKQKRLIEDIFIQNPNDNFTAEKIMSLLSNNNTPVSKATLYRTLDAMLNKGEIIRYNLDNNSSCYQYKSCKNTMHIHFKCQVCGEILHITNPIIRKTDKQIEQEYGVLIDTTKTILYGKCAKCKGGYM